MTILRKFTSKKIVLKRATVAALICCAFVFSGFDQGYAGQNETRAKQLQLEATKLQLKGDLENALIKYKESQELAPNPRLESIVKRLEKRVNKAQTPSQGSPSTEQATKVATTNKMPSVAAPTATETTPDPVVKETTALDNQEEQNTATTTLQTAQKTPAAQQTEPAVSKEVAELAQQGAQVPAIPTLKKYIAKDEQEQRICNYIDKQLDAFPKKKDGSSVVQAQYTIEKNTADSYRVIFDIFTIPTENTTLNFAPILVDVTPQGDFLSLNAQLAKKLSLGDSKRGVEIEFTEQHITAQWDEKLQTYRSLDAAFSPVSMKGIDSDDVTIVIGSAKASNALKSNTENSWSNAASFALDDITIAEKNASRGQLHVDSLSGKNETQGKDLTFYLDKISENFDFLNDVIVADKPQEVADPKKLAVLDTFIQLWSGTTGNFALQGLEFTEEDVLFSLDTIEAKSAAKKDPASKKINSEAAVTVQGLHIVEKNSRSSSIERMNLESLSFTTTGNLHAIPEQLFEKTGMLISDILQAEDKQQYLTQGKEQLSAFLALFASWGLNAELKNMTVTPAGPDDKVHLDSLAIKHGIDATPESGGLISLMYTLAGLKVDMETGFIIPEAAQISIELSKIPSLIEFIAGTNNTPLEQLEQQLPNLLLQSVMGSQLTLKIADSFIAFPQSQLRIDGTSTVDPNSPFFSSSSLKATMVNPENFLKNVEALNALVPGISQIMATYTALANRTTGADGITTDVLAIETTQEGKILSNGKDVTSMLLGGK